VIGEVQAKLLDGIDRHRSITEAAKKIDVSYKYAWDQLVEIEKALGQPVVVTMRGGPKGGGGTRLTDFGKRLLKEYRRVEKYVKNLVLDREEWEAIRLKISARNRLKGVVSNVEKGPITSRVKIEVKVPVTITAVITKEAVEDLDLKPGDAVEAVIKATEVMVAKE